LILQFSTSMQEWSICIKRKNNQQGCFAVIGLIDFTMQVIR